MENISKLTPILYEKNETNFNHNGLGKLTNLLVNEIDEGLNGEFEAFFEYPANGRLADKIDYEMFIKAKPNKKDDPHVFKVYDYDLDTFSQTYLIYARSKNIEDLRNNVILDVNVRDLAPTQAWNLAKNNALDSVVTTFYSDITTPSSVHWERRSLLSIIAGEQGSMIQYWGGEIKHGIDWVGLYRRRGQDNVTTVRHGKNLDGLKATYSTKGLVTAIVPYYIKGEDNAVYGDVVKSQYINNYPNTYYDIVEYSDEDLGLNSEDEPDNNDILNALNSKASRWFDEHPEKDLPSINMEIALEDISQTKEYELFKDFEQIELGDTITVYSKKFNVKVTAKVQRVVYNGLTDKNETVEVGTVRRGLYDDVREDFKNDINRVENQLQEGIDHAMASANGKNTNYHGTADPNEVGLVGKDGDNYFRENGQLKELWIYRDGMWHLEVGDLTGEQIRAEIAEQQKDIAEAQTTADEAVNRINGEIAGKFTDIDTEISQVHQDAQNALNQAGEAVSQVAYFGETLDGFTQTVANIDGRVANIRHDVDGITQTVTDQTGKIATVEQNVNGIQQTVSDPVNGLVTQVSTLASGFNVLVTDFENMEIGGRNLISNSNQRVTSSDYLVKEYVINEDFIQGEIYTAIIKGSVNNGQEFGLWQNIGSNSRGRFEKLGKGIYKLTFASVATTSGNERRIRIYNAPSSGANSAVIEWIKFVKGNKTSLDWSPAPEDMASQAQLSVLNDNINMRVQKGDVLGQINLEAGRTLIENDKVLINANTTVITGTAWMSGAVIANASMDGAKIVNATIASGKIINLDVSKISGNTSNFVQSNWNANGSDVRITGSGLLSTAGDGSQTYLQNGIVGTRNPSGNSIGHIGYSNLTGTMTYAITTAAGAHFAIGSNQINDHYGPIPLFQIIAGSNETYIRTNNFRHTGTGLGGDVFARFSGDVTIDKELRMGGTNIVQPYGIYFNNTGSSIYSTTGGVYRMDTSSSGIIQFRVGGNQKFRIDSTRNYSSQILNMQGNAIVESPSVSDARMKDIYGIRTDNDLGKLMKIEYVDFRWKDPEFGDEDLGFIAQQVQSIVPEIIKEVAGGMLGYNRDSYLNFIGHSVQQLALREINTNKVASQALQLGESNEEKIKQLEKRIEELESAA